MSISYLFQQIINGLVTGCCYSLMGVGLSLVWGILRMVSLNHGELYMAGAYFTWLSFVNGLPIIPAAAVGILATMVLGFLIEQSMIRPMLNRPNLDNSAFILTMAIQTLLQNVALRVFGEKYQNLPYYNDGIYRFLGVTISGQRILIVIVTVVVIVALMLFIRYTRTGRAISATSQERDASVLMGVNTQKIYIITYVISGALAAVAGIMLAPIYSVNPWMGSAIQTKGLVVCVLAGLGSVEGAIGAGLLLGLAESLAITFIDSSWMDMVSYLLMILILWVKPNGLFGKKGA